MTSSTVPPSSLDTAGADAALSEACALEKEISRVRARQMRALDRYSRCVGSRRSATAELALVASMTSYQAEKKLALAEALVRRLPCTLAAMERGEIDELKAAKIAEPTSVLSDELARRVDEIIVQRVAGKNSSTLRRAVNWVVMSVDPEGYAGRSKARRRTRQIRLHHDDETMSTLTAKLPGEQAGAIYASVDRAARKARRLPGETRTTEQLRADVFADRLLAARHGDAGVRADIHVYVDLLTLAGLNKKPAELAGYGPIPAWLARQIATDPNSTWTRLITDPDTGQLLSVGRRKYRPPANLDGFIRVRDRECGTPGCHRPAQFADIDHVDDWHAKNGETSVDNLGGRCGFHHKVKDEPGWQHIPHKDGSYTIITPTGRRFTHGPEPLHEPRRPKGPEVHSADRSRRNRKNGKRKNSENGRPVATRSATLTSREKLENSPVRPTTGSEQSEGTTAQRGRSESRGRRHRHARRRHPGAGGGRCHRRRRGSGGHSGQLHRGSQERGDSEQGR
ncbi:DUF222 domain-containing protein [Amycolatopsis sp. NPDC058986]|uniref:HNH endonuclease signature motif containing protein n=1 Tax=unclassified Amycolatopsis TaxID=2618356 RepID=UPI00366FFBFF